MGSRCDFGFPFGFATRRKGEEGLTLEIIGKRRVVLNDGLHERRCCWMVTRPYHLSPICPTVRTRPRPPS